MIDMLINCWCLTPLSAIFQLYHGNQFYWLKKLEYPERTTDHGQATGKLNHLRLSYFKLRFHNIPWKVRNKKDCSIYYNVGKQDTNCYKYINIKQGSRNCIWVWLS
jgi:hypothetical protein